MELRKKVLSYEMIFVLVNIVCLYMTLTSHGLMILLWAAIARVFIIKLYKRIGVLERMKLKKNSIEYFKYHIFSSKSTIALIEITAVAVILASIYTAYLEFILYGTLYMTIGSLMIIAYIVIYSIYDIRKQNTIIKTCENNIKTMS